MFMALPSTVTPADSLRAVWVGPETLATTNTGVSAGVAPYLEMLPVKSYKSKLMDARLTTQELVGTRIRDTSTVRLYKHNDLTLNVYQRFDKMGWLLRNLIGTPVTVSVGNTSTNCVQTVTLGGSWLSTDSMTFTIGGYTSGLIPFASTNATFLSSSTTVGAMPQLAALPSVMSTVSTGTTGNLLIAPTMTTATGSIVFTFQKNLAHTNIPLIGVSTNSAGGTISVVNSTPGVGAYQHTFTAGASGLLPLTFGEYNGISYQTLQSGAIDSADLTMALNDAPLWALKCITQAEVVSASIPNTLPPTSTATAFPGSFFSSMTNTCDPTQLLCTINGSTFATVLAGKVSGKNNRAPINAMGSGSGDMIRASEGVASWSGQLTLRYNVAYSASEYANYVNNVAPGGSTATSGIVLSWQGAASSIGGNQTPLVRYTFANPKYVNGEPNADTPETQQILDFIALLDQPSGTDVTAVLINECPRYTALTA